VYILSLEKYSSEVRSRPRKIRRKHMLLKLSTANILMTLSLMTGNQIHRRRQIFHWSERGFITYNLQLLWTFFVRYWLHAAMQRLPNWITINLRRHRLLKSFNQFFSRSPGICTLYTNGSSSQWSGNISFFRVPIFTSDILIE